MAKNNKIILISVFFIFSFLSVGFSQERITITTYYPSPFGSYNELTVAQRQAIGDVNLDGQVNAGDLAVDNVGNAIPGSLTMSGSLGIGTTTPARNLDIAIGNGIRIAPSALPVPAGNGDVAIDNTDNNLKWYAAGAWRTAGGGGALGTNDCYVRRPNRFCTSVCKDGF